MTGIVRTLVDFASVHGRSAVERAVNEADRLDLIDPSALRREMEAHRCEPGVLPLRDLLDRHGLRFTRSELERRFLPLAAEAGLSLPETNRIVNGYEVDFFWPDLDLVVETDGLRYHRTAAQQSRDRIRDQAHTAAGMTQLRFTHEQIRDHPEHVVSILRRTAESLTPARPAALAK